MVVVVVFLVVVVVVVVTRLWRERYARWHACVVRTVRRAGGDDSEGNIIHSGVIRSKQ